MIARPRKLSEPRGNVRPALQINSRFAVPSMRASMKIDSVTYKVADCRAEREAAFRLLYQAYTQAGLMKPNEYQMRVTPHHLLATTDVFIAIRRGEVISTLSLIGDGELGVPMQSIYDGEITKLRQQGNHFGEVSCLADKREYVADFLPVFINLSALVIQHARHNGMDQLLIVVHPRHERFYGRLLGFERIGEERSYPSVCDNPAVACNHSFDRLDDRRYPLYDQMYEIPYSSWDLMPQPMLESDREYFRPATEFSNSYVPMAA